MRKNDLVGLDVKTAPDDAPILIWVDPHSIKPNYANWRIHPDDQKTLVGDAIDDPEIRWAGVCLYNKRTKEFIDGHLRREHALSKGIDRIPVLVGDWSPEKQAAIHASLDISTGMARPDIPKLLALAQKASPPTERAGEILRRLAEKQGVEFPSTGDDNKPSGDDNGSGGGGSGKSEDDEIEALRAKWECESGQVWGFDSADGRKHRIVIGDSSLDDTITKLFVDIKPDLIVTSPPYDDLRKYSGDLPPWNELMQGVFGAIPYHADTQLLVNLGPKHEDCEVVVYWWEWKNWMRSRGWRWFGWYVWDQRYGIVGDWNGRLAPCHEWILHFNKNSINVNKTEVCTSAGDDRMRHTLAGPRSADHSRSGGTQPGETWFVGDRKIPDSVIRVHRAISQGIAHLHPAIYSIDLAKKLIESYSQDKHIIYDPFGGALTTIIAAEKSGRIGYASEIHPGYVAIGLERLSNAGFKPSLVR